MVLIRYWVQLGRPCGFPVLSMTLFLQCGKWVNLSRDNVSNSNRPLDMSVEGIFRKNGNIRRLKELTETIDRDPSSVDLTQDNPVQLAALLKKFLRELPDPLMTFKLHRLFIASQCKFSIGSWSTASNTLPSIVNGRGTQPLLASNITADAQKSP